WRIMPPRLGPSHGSVDPFAEAPGSPEPRTGPSYQNDGPARSSRRTRYAGDSERPNASLVSTAGMPCTPSFHVTSRFVAELARVPLGVIPTIQGTPPTPTWWKCAARDRRYSS